MKAIVLLCLLSIAATTHGAEVKIQVLEEIQIGELELALVKGPRPRLRSRQEKTGLEQNGERGTVTAISLTWSSEGAYSSGSYKSKKPADYKVADDATLKRGKAIIDGETAAIFDWNICHVNKRNQWRSTIYAQEWGDQFVSLLAQGTTLQACGFNFDLSGARQVIENSEFFSDYLLK